MGTKKSHIAKWLFIAVSLLCISLIAFFVYSSHVYVSSDGDKTYSVVFNDPQAKHLGAAKKKGLTCAPLASATDLNPVELGLTRIHSNRYLKIGHLSHSAPYLTKVAADELNQIAKDFQTQVQERKLPYCRILVTSVLRTAEDVEQLKKVNTNATTMSAHMYGTTFDIAWSYYQSRKRNASGDDYFKVLASVLTEHRDAKKVYVRYETQQRCFHITVR